MSSVELQNFKFPLLSIHKDYDRNLAPILHLAFAQIRKFYDKLYQVTDNYPDLIEVGDQIDFPLDQILTHVKLLDKVFDDVIRPIRPERFGKKEPEEKLALADVMIQLVEHHNLLLQRYAELELEGKSDISEFKAVISELGILCVLFLNHLEPPVPKLV